MLNIKSFGAAIKSKRTQLKLTQNQLAEAAQLSRNYVSDIENGRYTPSVETITRIATFLDIDLNLLKMTEIQVDK